MFVGVDIGTSGVKGVLVDEHDRVIAEATAPLDVQRPQPLWCEQDPRAWWQATVQVMDRLAQAHPLSNVAALGLSGQMLGVTLLDGNDEPLRPALLWNDGRAAEECALLEARVPDLAQRVGCRAMPGFSAPKLLWLARHQSHMIDRTRRVLLTKDYVRLCLTGEPISDLADASATLLMETREGRWSDHIANVCGLSTEVLPRLVPSDVVSASLRPELATRWGLPPALPIAGGAGDNMCGAVGAGVIARGDACISLGTSGVYFVANDQFVPAVSAGMHTHRHAVNALYCQHGVVLSAAGALSWLGGVLGIASIENFVRDIETSNLPPADVPVFTPYLGGERTPHNDPLATAAFSGMRHTTTAPHLGRAVLDGVALAIADCHDALLGDVAPIDRIVLIGGGARSRLWCEIIATVLDRTVEISADAAVGPALGAARLARKAIGGALIGSPTSVRYQVVPRAEWREQYAMKRELFRRQYAALRHS